MNSIEKLDGRMEEWKNGWINNIPSFQHSIIVFLLTCFLTSSSQTFHFKNYSVDDGLPFIQVATIYQDNAGNLWTGGYGGLSKFDGHKFTNYSPKNGLSHHTVTNIMQDTSGNIWVSTINGLNKFDGKKFTIYTVDDGLPDNSITDLLTDAYGNLWIATMGGLCKYDGTSFQNSNELKGVRVSCLLKAHDNAVLVGAGKTIYTINTATNSKADESFVKYVTNEEVTALSEDDSNHIWMGTSSGIYKFGKAQEKIQGLTDKYVKTICKDADNNIWAGTPTGLYRYDKTFNSFKEIVVSKELNAKIIESLYSDYEGNFWIGTYNGLYKYKGERFLQYSEKEGLNNTFIFQILRDQDDHLFVGTSGGGFYKLIGDKFINITKKDGLAGNVVNTAVLDNKKLFIGTNGGLSISNDNAFKNFSRKDDLKSDSVSAILKNNDGTFWIGGHNCITLFDGNKFKNFPINTVSKNFDVWSIVKDKNGIVWAGTYLGGILKFDGQQFNECSKDFGIKSPSTLNILSDGDYMIFGSLEGLYIYDGKTVYHINEEDGLNSNLIWFLYRDSKENIWIGTNQGVNRFYWGNFKRTKEVRIKSYGKEEGFEGVECNSNGAFEDKDGTIWFGTVNGLIRYNPAFDSENKLESRTNIVNIQVNDRDTFLEQNSSLAYNQNRIVFEFVGICFSNPAKVEYQYILEGSGKQWSQITSENVITYSSLSPGKYTFKVKSCNNESVWNKEPVSFTFTILPPFWATWWFRILSTLVVSLTIFLFFYNRIQQIRKEERERTELQKRIANVELMALRSQMNPHFIFNTMSSIQHFITQNATDEALKYLSKFAKLMRAIMENTKQSAITIKEEIDTLRLYLDLESMRFAGRFDYKLNVASSLDQNYEEIPSMIIQPYVENAIIHGLLPKQGSGKLLVNLEKKDNFIICTIEDDGIGRVRANEINMNKLKRHRSMGMAITKERLAILSSVNKENFSEETIDLYDDQKSACGTRVVIRIPVEIN